LSVSALGIHTPVIDTGPADAAEAVVFVHGNPGSGEDFRDLSERIAPLARAISPTMPGFGKADRPRDLDVSPDGYGRHLGAQLDALGVERAHLVLHDLGGPWGLAWALQHPEAFASVALLNTGVLTNYRWHFWARVWQTPVLGELVMLGPNLPRRFFRMNLDRGQTKPLPADLVDRMYEDFDRPMRRNVLRTYRAMKTAADWSAQAAPRLRALDRPALVLWGEHDPYLGSDLVQEQAAAFARMRSVSYPAAGHWPHVDEPEAVASELVRWVREQTAATR
jgi:pimeloyl-ACP methyl ester carboxylesterase